MSLLFDKLVNDYNQTNFSDLINHYDINFVSNDYLYNCPLYISITKSNYELTKLLLENGADPNQACNVEFTPLSLAILKIENESEKKKIVKLLIDHGANIFKSLDKIKNVRNIFWKNEYKQLIDYTKLLLDDYSLNLNKL